jgi:hypothetical protein
LLHATTGLAGAVSFSPIGQIPHKSAFNTPRNLGASAALQGND